METSGNPDEGQAAAPEITETGAPVADETQGQEQFLEGSNLDPRKLDPALQPIFKQMQGAYTKRMQALSEIRDKAAVVDRFYSDPQFAQQTLQQWAYQNGYQLTPAGGPQQQAQQGNAPSFLVDAFKSNLPQELQWLADPLAKAMGTSMQGMLAPLAQQQQQAQQASREAEWDKSANELAGVAPGWEEHEDTMGQIFDFMQSSSQYHPVFGSKLQMLYDLATAKSASLKQATQRVAQAGKNRVTSGRPVATRPALENQIRSASSQDAWKLAVQHALEQHRRSGT